MTRNKTKKTRITLDVSEAFNERMERLLEIVEADSKASLIRQALQLYEYIAHRTQEKYEFRMVKDGIARDFAFLGPTPPPSGTSATDSDDEGGEDPIASVPPQPCGSYPR